MPPKYTPEQRVAAFWTKVDKTADHWLWTASGNGNGYGRVNTESRQLVSAHHMAWMLASGESVPDGLDVLHTCDIRACVRNDDHGTYELDGVLYERRGHLWLGTDAANARDRAVKGRSRANVQITLRAHPELRARGERNGQAKLTVETVGEIRRRYAAGSVTQAKLARDLEVSKSLISAVVRYELWPDVS